MTEALPELPEPGFENHDNGDVFGVEKTYFYTADDMRAYARAALEAKVAPEPPAPRRTAQPEDFRHEPGEVYPTARSGQGPEAATQDRAEQIEAAMRLAKDCASKLATPANWHVLRAHLEGMTK